MNHPVEPAPDTVAADHGDDREDDPNHQAVMCRDMEAQCGEYCHVGCEVDTKANCHVDEGLHKGASAGLLGHCAAPHWGQR